MNNAGFGFDPRQSFSYFSSPFTGYSGSPVESEGFLKSLGFDKTGDLFSSITGLLSGAGQLYGGLQNYKLGKDMLNLSKKQFGFEKALANRNIANQAKTINNAYNNAAQVAAGMIGSVNPNGEFGFTDPATVKKYTDAAKKQHVSGAAIG